jgi:hypothetical protein
MFATSEIAIVVTAKDQATQVVTKVGESLKKWAPLMRAGAIGIAGLGAALIKLGRDTDRLETANKTYLTSLEKMELSVGKVLRPLTDMAPVLVTLGGLLMLLSWKAGRAAAALVVEKVALGISTVATKVATAANLTYTMSVGALTVAVTALVAVLTVLAAVVVAGLLIWQGVERRKREAIQRTNDALRDQTNTLQSELEKLKKEQEATWSDMTDAAETAYEDSVDAARKFYGDVEEMDNSLMAQERKRYDAEITAIDEKYSKIIAGYNEELGLLDKASEGSKRASQDAADADEIAHLEALKSVAMTEAERAKLTDDINELIAVRAQRWAEQTTEDRRDQINQNIRDAQTAAEDEKTAAQTASDVIIKGYNDQGLAAIQAAAVIRTAALAIVQTQKDEQIPTFLELQVRVEALDAALDKLEGKPHLNIKNLEDFSTALAGAESGVGTQLDKTGLDEGGGTGGGATSRLLTDAERQHLYQEHWNDMPSQNKVYPYWLDSRGKPTMTSAYAQMLADMPGFKMASGGSGIVTKPTAFLAGEAGPEAFSFAPLGAGGTGGTTYIDNRKISIGSWLGDRQGIEELVDRLQPVMRTRERWGTGKVRY